MSRSALLLGLMVSRMLTTTLAQANTDKFTTKAIIRNIIRKVREEGIDLRLDTETKETKIMIRHN